jgi:hypothetical protein
MRTARPASRKAVLRCMISGVGGPEGRVHVYMRRCTSTCIGGVWMFAMIYLQTSRQVVLRCITRMWRFRRTSTCLHAAMLQHVHRWCADVCGDKVCTGCCQSGDVGDAAAPRAHRLRSWRPRAPCQIRSSSWRPRARRCWSARAAAPRRPATARRPARRPGPPVLGLTAHRTATGRTGRSRVRRRPGQKTSR